MHALGPHGIGQDGRSLLTGVLALHDAADLPSFAAALPQVVEDLIAFDAIALVGDLGEPDAAVPSAFRLAIATPGAGRTLLGVLLGRERRFTPRELAVGVVAGPHLGAAADHVRLRQLDRGWTAGRGADVLTPRERQVLAQIADGRTDRDIAGVLHIGPRTVEKHVEHIRAKLGARSRAEAVARWARSDA